MKKWSRLTALVLAFAIVLSTVSGALAQIEIDHDDFQTWVADTKEAEGLSGVISIDQGGEVLVEPSTFTGELNQGPLYTSETSKNLNTYAQGSAPTVDVQLGQYGKVDLVAPSAGKWQVYLSAADLWVNITGETGSTFALTYAKVKGMIDADGAAKIRCLMGESVTETVNVHVSYEASAIVVNAAPAVSQPMVMSARAVAADAQAEGDIKDTYSVIINYVFADGEQAASPWTATVHEGSSVYQTVASPAVLGYTPDKAEVSIEIENISADATYTVTYNAAKVEYTLLSEVTDTGYTESAVGSGLANTYTGFYSLLYDETTEIAADGSTVVEIYYDRYYYLMSFDLAGGYGDGCEPIYARYGAPVTAGTPTRAGYTFAGWKDEKTGTVYTVKNFPYGTMPAANTKFVAQWTAGNTTYDVVFWYENADDTNFSQAGVLYDVTAVAGSEVDGAVYANNTSFSGYDADYAQHFTYAYADQKVTIKGDGSTIINVYYSRNKYTLTFVNSVATHLCDAEQHTHTAECGNLVCTIEEHNHVDSNCSLSCSHTAHTLDCYQGDYDASLRRLNSKPNYTLTSIGNGIYTYEAYYYGSYYTCYVVNIGDNWYENEYGPYVGISLNCSHPHNDSCYSCGKTNHTHVSGCYDYTCGKYEHTHTNNQCTIVITKKYDSDITGIWSEKPISTLLNNGCVFQSSVTSMYYSFLEKMPEQNITMTAVLWSGYTYKWYYYLEVLPNSDTTGLTIRTDGGKTYYEYDSTTVKSDQGLSLTYDEDYYPITGFTQRDKTVPDFNNNRTAYLYYVRNSYDLAFSNNGSIVTGKGGTFLYEADISGQYFVPDYPANLEPNAYVFEGWYTSPFFGDTKFEFTTTDEEGNVVSRATMPAKDITLYARWVPKEHKVNIYLTNKEGVLGNPVGKTQVVAHRETATNPYPDVVNNPPKHPDSEKYVFVGWFYMDGETEKAFDFSMPVTQDLDLYAKWSSNTLIEYRIRYAVKNEDGTLTYIAEDTTGSGLAGTTKTFPAKAGEELNEGYQRGYFPTTNSHSLTLDIVDLENNEYTFIYVPKEKLPYKVLYLEYDGNDVYDGTEKQLHDPKTDATSDAIITETFEPVTGYMPDAYQKRLVLSANEAENVIIFWYTKDAVHAPVQIIHYIQNAEGDDYSIYQESTDLNGVINQSYSTNVLNITGFDYDHATANDVAVEDVNGKVNGTVTENGLILELYYVREVHPYEFRFLEQGTNKKLADPVTGEARYGSQVTQKAKTIPGYKLVSEEAQAITIQTEDGETAVNNVRIFYYQEVEVTINYEVVGPTGSGTVTPGSEKLKAVTGEAQGSTATAATGYTFVGWYSDDKCTVQVDTDAQYTPVVGDDGVFADGETYYAKFVENTTTINYIAVGPEGQTNFGTVTPESNEIGVVNGPAPYSVADANLPTFKFVGWYKDAKCEDPVRAEWLTDTTVDDKQTINPPKQDHDDNPDTPAIYVGATYYAKFDWNVSTLTISKTVATLNGNTDDPANAAVKKFDFQISNLEKGKEYTYSISNVDGQNTFTTDPDGVGTITLAAGQTAVIEGIVIGTAVVVSETAEKYYNTSSTPANGTVTIDADGETVAFTNTYTKYKTGSLTLTKQFQDASFTEETKSVTLLLKLKSDLNNPLDPELEKQFEEWALTADGTNKGWNGKTKEASIVITVAASAKNKTNSVTLNNLPVADYVVTEMATMPEYNVVYEPEDGCATVTAASTSVPVVKVINTITGKRDIVVNKKWEDLDNKYGVRPEEIQLTLLANGVAATSTAQGFVNPAQVTGTENQWQVTFAGLDTFDTQGNFIVYTVDELAVPEYAVTNTESIVDLSKNALNITNTIQRADLTISKTGLNAFVYKSGGDHESALFKVEATDQTKDDREWTVAINGNSSVTIKGVKIGVQYKVTELNDWTWRYKVNDSKTTEPITDAGAIVKFENKLDKTQWLNGDNYKVNVFGPSND